jgi:phosphoserine phosphatase
MLELLAFLRANEFSVFIASGGGIEFVRTFCERVYGIPPERVIGSSIETKFEVRDGGPVLVRRPKVDFIDDYDGKPVGINRFIGRRPIAAFGNSDGDYQILEWVTGDWTPLRADRSPRRCGARVRIRSGLGRGHTRPRPR